ncbi:MAG: hypothetical protein ACLFNU_05665 [Bacteroidales bacterium]
MKLPSPKPAVIIKTLFWLVIQLLVFQSYGQRLTSFSEDETLYPSELLKVVEGHFEKSEEESFEQFEEFWASDTLSSEIKSDVVYISNLLLKKTVVSTRHLIMLAKNLMLYSEQEKFQTEIDTWLAGLKEYAEDETIRVTFINKFLENSYALFTERTFFINPAFRWKLSNDNYRFALDETLLIKFDNTDFVCATRNDSITILSTRGTFYPLNDTLVGNGGKVTWIRSQFPTDEIYATLSDYSINLTRNEYHADSVLFTNMDYFRQPSLGKLQDKITRVSDPEKVQYPQFYTYDQRHSIRNLFENVHFDGGYHMLGSQFIGSGTRENPAIIEIFRDDEDFLRVESQTYIFKRQTVMSDYARVRFKLAEDSLFHTGLNFTYNDRIRLLSVAPTDFLTTQSPIQSSYHNFSINFGQIRWNLDSDELVFGAPVGSSRGRAHFESNNFFNEEEFDRLMGRDEVHPLFAVANFTRRLQSKVFNVDDFSKFIRKPDDQTRIAVMRLAMEGYVFYEFETGEVQALPKLYDAIRARGQFIDYDVLRFSSTAEGEPNATLNLNSLEMFIRGVENVSVSDSQNVFLYPANQELTLKGDRNFAFDGRVRAGLFTFYGNEFNFDYENFSLELASIDSLQLDYQTDDYDSYGERILKNVTSTLENITGEILIDEPDNKSGLIMNEDYPIFNSTKSSFVYYDDETIHNGVYNREKFFFEVFPFTFKNINNFEYSDMNFIGTLYSADIFAPIEDTLVLRPDNSLGFRRETADEGYALYQGRGRFYNRVDLSNEGLRGLGEVTYITSRTASDNIYFFPDSMRTQSSDFNIARQDAGIQYPKVMGGEHLIKWFPYDEQLLAFKGDKPFKMFQDQARLKGNLTLEPLGLIGDGLLDMNKARLRSDEYAFNAIDFNTDEASVEFDVVNTDDIAFISNMVKAWVNFDNQEGVFQSVEDRIYAELPPMMYQSQLEGFHWAMDENELTISTPSHLENFGVEDFYVSGMVDKDSIPQGSLFFSEHTEEDSLYFFSKTSRYSLAQPNIKADSVKYLVVADAIINPHKQKIEVDAKERVIPFKKSDITANYTQKYHHIYNAEVSIPSRKKYYAKGTIDYVDEEETVQPVDLNEIGVNKDGNTFAKTSITQPDSFKLSPYFGFIGNVDILATEEYWTYQGGAQPIHNCEYIKSSNIKFQAQLKPDDIFIPISHRPRNMNEVELISGSVVTVDSIHLYPSFLTDMKEHSDRTLITAEGYMHYNKKRSRFQIGSRSKINDPDTTGNLISLNNDFCMLFSEGVVDIPVNLGQIKNQTTGLLTHTLEDSALNMNVVMSLDFHFSKTSLEAMASEILLEEGLASVDLDRKLYHDHINTLVDPDQASTAINQIKLFGAMTEVPKELESTISFSYLKMKWDHKNSSFVSEGRLGIGNLGNTQVNKRVNGFIEIYKRNTGDRMTIYIELAPDKYYVFYYVRGSMQVSSHNPLFTEPINDMRKRERRVRVKAGEIPFNFAVGTRRELERSRERYHELIGKDELEEEEQEGEVSDEVDEAEDNETNVDDGNVEEDDSRDDKEDSRDDKEDGKEVESVEEDDNSEDIDNSVEEDVDSSKESDANVEDKEDRSNEDEP